MSRHRLQADLGAAQPPAGVHALKRGAPSGDDPGPHLRAVLLQRGVCVRPFLSTVPVPVQRGSVLRPGGDRERERSKLSQLLQHHTLRVHVEAVVETLLYRSQSFPLQNTLNPVLEQMLGFFCHDSDSHEEMARALGFIYAHKQDMTSSYGTVWNTERL